MERLMKTYTIPMTWEVFGTIEVEADSLEEAIIKADLPETEMPSNGDYIEDSLHVDHEAAESYNG